jgi:hypothetical protein
MFQRLLHRHSTAAAAAAASGASANCSSTAAPTILKALAAKVLRKLGQYVVNYATFRKGLFGMTDSVGSGIELSERPQESAIQRQQTFVSLPTPDEKKSDEQAAGKLPPEAPPPVAPFQLHVQSLKNLVSAGLDMKNQADYNALVQPLMNRCGGSIEKLASMIDAPLSGGLKDFEGAEKRREAFGANRLPEKEMVRTFCVFL